MIPGALMQEQTVVHAANARAHAATRARSHLWLDQRDVRFLVVVSLLRARKA